MDNSQAFIISAHVIEHLLDPIGAIQAGMRILHQSGHYVISVPDKRFTFDKARPITPLTHLLKDWEDGGHSTQLEAYIEHLRFVHPNLGNPVLDDGEIQRQASIASSKKLDIHFHNWTFDSFREMLSAIEVEIGFRTIAAVPEVVNENIFVLKKL